MTHHAARDRHRFAADAEPRAAHAAFADQRHGDAFRRRRRDGKADALRRQDDRRVDADHLSPRVDQRAAGVARIERGVRLQDVVEQAPRAGPHRAAEAADDAGGDGVAESVRAADRDGDLPDAQAARVAEPAPAEIGRGDLEHGEVGIRIVADDFRARDAPIGQRDLDRRRTAGDVAVGER